MVAKFRLSQRSLDRLDGVHDDLVKVVKRAIQLTKVDFAVLEGMRTLDRQTKLVAAGASWTYRSRHLTGHAVDLGAWIDGRIAWDWPPYYAIAGAMFEAAKELQISLEWGGDWSDGHKDGPHFQLPWSDYPVRPADVEKQNRLAAA